VEVIINGGNTIHILVDMQGIKGEVCLGYFSLFLATFVILLTGHQAHCNYCKQA
jgi:hypothetical protein